MMKLDVMIEFKSVNKYYKVGDEVQEVLTDFNLSISRGDFVLLKGPSGSGKSTVLNLILGIERPSSGEILYNFDTGYHRDDSESTPEKQSMNDTKRNLIGTVFQFFNLDHLLTVEENIFASSILSDVDGSLMEFQAEARKLLEMTGILNRKDHYPSEISAGEKQRVCLCRAVFNNPEILLADEPTGNLDEKNKKALFEILRNLNKDRGITVVVATHDNPKLDGLDMKKIDLTQFKEIE
ncbi:MAG: ABC transporter ATP-binding protein [Candidatus Hodarchaeales archaeon]